MSELQGIRKKSAQKKQEAMTVLPLVQLPGTKEEQLHALYGQWYACKRCDLCQTRPNDDIVYGDGNPDADVLIIGEAPGTEEEATSMPFVGQSGKLLNQLLAATAADPDIKASFEEFAHSPRAGARGENAAHGFHTKVFAWRQQTFFITNALGCHPEGERPGETRAPTKEERAKCWDRLANIIYIVDPLLIVTCGISALSAVLQKDKVVLSEMRGKVYDATYQGRVGVLRYPVIPTFHPSYLLRKADYKQSGGDFEKTMNDWRKVFRFTDFLKNQYYGTPVPERG